MKHIAAIIIAASLTGCAGHFGEGWSRADTIRQIGATAVTVADWGQTRYSATTDEYVETNPILGEFPSKGEVNTYFTSVIVANTLIPMGLKPEYRKWYQTIVIVVESAYVYHNTSIGVEFDF